MATKKRIAIMNYLDAEGKNVGSNAKIGTTAIVFNFVKKTGEDAEGKAVYETTETETVKFADLPDSINVVAAAHGLKQKLSDSYAGSKGRSTDPHEDFMSMVEQLGAGEWLQPSKAGSGPRISMVVEAMLAALADMGKDIEDTTRIAAVRASVSTTEGRAAAMNNPAVVAHYAKAQAVKATEKAKKAAAALKSSDTKTAGLEDF